MFAERANDEKTAIRTAQTYITIIRIFFPTPLPVFSCSITLLSDYAPFYKKAEHVIVFADRNFTDTEVGY